MKLHGVKVTRVRNKHVEALVGDYQKRIGRFTSVSSDSLKDISQKSLESFSSKGKVVLLDQRGKGLSSEQLSEKLRLAIDDPVCKQWTFVVGPAYGWPEDIDPSRYECWSLSHATLPGELAWLVCWEQLYRGYAILKGLPYHHGE